MGNGLTVYATLPNGQTIQPILTCLGGQIVMTEIGQFSKSSLQFAASDERVLMALTPFTILEVVQDNVGTIAFGYILNPRQQVSQQDQHTITLDLEGLSVECTWRRLHRGWQAVAFIDVIASRLGSFTPGWTGVFLDGGTPSDIVVSETLNDQTPLQGFLNFGKDFNQYVRQGVDSTGAPTRVLEMGQMGAPPTVTLVSPNGGNADDMAGNPTIRLIATVDYQPNDVSSLVNVCTPFGGGSSTDTVVTLERLWRIINDPTYPNYGKYGTVAGSVFPEYDPAYPISDPDNPPTGTATFINGQLSQGAIGTRYFTVDGHSDYMVYDAASVALYGHKEGQFVDSGITYTDPSPTNQELTERALYIETTTNFKKFAHPHHLFSCTTNDASSRPTRAGDLIALDYQRVSTGDDGAVVEMNVVDTLRVMSVVRTFTVPSGNTETPPTDTYILSNLGRFDQTDAAGLPTSETNMIALQINQGTGLAKDSVTAFGNVDAENPLTIWHFIVSEHFRYHQVRVKCDFFPFRGTATTATNIAGTPVVSADVSVELPTPNGLNAAPAAIGAMPEHIHQIQIETGGNTAPTASTPYVYIDVLGGAIRGNGGTSARFSSLPGFKTAVDVTPTNHPHTVATAGSTVAHIPAGQRLADLPAHVHDVEKRIPTGQPSPASITMTINGQNLSSGASTSGTRNSDGSFGSSFIVQDIGVYLDTFTAGTDVPLTFESGTSSGNPFGVGFLQVTITSVEELGGSVGTFRTG